MASSGMKGFYRQKKKGGVSKPSPSFSNKSTSAAVAAASSSFAVSGSDASLMDLHGDGEEERSKELLLLLQQFDLDMRYGPCLGLTRMERWDRASTMGLNPPADVRSMLLRSEPSVAVGCLWEGRV